MPEVRIEFDKQEVEVLDAYCIANGKDRTKVIHDLVSAWAAQKLYEATLILRVAGGNPVMSEQERRMRESMGR